ncbi:MAG TPA: YbaB/EbfC family nucleoid-associated protein [Fimbriimonadales bacterium]|nr:YbaB/EbfC family nucleoid-associated protein [Fimbriimonadales bacterium]
MKLPKGLGNLGSLMQQAKETMARAQRIEEELKLEEIEVEKANIKAKFNGAGELLSIKIPPEMVNPNDVETLEDAITLVLREGQAKVNELREKRMKELATGLNLPPGVNPF